MQITIVYDFINDVSVNDTCCLAVGSGTQFLDEQENGPECCFNGCGHEI